MEGLLGFIIIILLFSLRVGYMQKGCNENEVPEWRQSQGAFLACGGRWDERALAAPCECSSEDQYAWGELKPAVLRSIRGNLLMALLLPILPSHRFHVGG